MALKLYFDAMSQPCRSVMLFLKCNNIDYTPKLIDIAKGQNRTEEYKKIHPHGLVPVIDDNGFILHESTAILQYLCNSRNVPDHWYPKDPKKRAGIDKYLVWHQSNLRKGAAYTFRGSILRPLLTGQPPEDVSKFIKILNSSMKTLEDQFMVDTDFISSDDVTIADLMALEEFAQLEVMGEKSPKLTSKILDWKDRCKARTEPHYNDVHKVMHRVRDTLAARSKL